AATAAEVPASARTGGGSLQPASGDDAEAAALAAAVAAAVSPLAGYARELPVRLRVAPGWEPSRTESAATWGGGEIGGVTSVGDQWAGGFDATATLMTAEGATVAAGRATVPRGGRTFRVALTASQRIAPGEYLLRVGARAGVAAIPPFDNMRIT